MVYSSHICFALMTYNYDPKYCEDWMILIRICLVVVVLYHMSRTWWRHQMETFSALLAICAENLPVPVKSQHKGQWRAALMFTLICAPINGWINNREVGDLRRHRARYDVIVMNKNFLHLWLVVCWDIIFIKRGLDFIKSLANKALQIKLEVLRCAIYYNPSMDK